MIKTAHSLLFLAVAGSHLFAQSISGVVNSASFTADLSPGTLATLFGTNLATGTGGSSNFPTTLVGTSIEINGIPVPLLYVSPTQINFQMPYEVKAGSATAIVYSDQYRSGQFTFDVYQTNPGIFETSNQDSISQNPDGSLNDQYNPAAPGATVVVYLTGIGPLDNPIATGQLSPSSPLSRSALSVSATIGGQPAQITFLGLTPGFLGLAQANIVMPNVKDGDYPLVINVGGGLSNAPYIAISAGGVRNQVRLARMRNAVPATR